MYIPRSHAEERPEELAAFVATHPLGILVTSGCSSDLFATHMPFVFDPSAGEHGVLEAHLARANPHHKLVDAVSQALVIFTGPDAYITPNWYPTKRTHGREVPTWNYIAVHAYGTLRLIDDPEWLLAHLRRLSAQSEATRLGAGGQSPWRVDDAPPDYIAQQMKAIVGIEIRVTRLEGKWKMSQNKSPETIDGVIAGLSASPKPMDREVATIVAARRPDRAGQPSRPGSP
jgi:transcriptional regulator